jgi:hypothetical protein
MSFALWQNLSKWADERDEGYRGSGSFNDAEDERTHWLKRASEVLGQVEATATALLKHPATNEDTPGSLFAREIAYEIRLLLAHGDAPK